MKRGWTWLFGVAVLAALSSCVSLDGLSSGGLDPVCGDGKVDPGEQCDGDACCTPTCIFANAGQQCRPEAGPCDVPEACTGNSAACPPDVFAPASLVCRASTAPCDTTETCSGSAAECPTDMTTCGSACRPGRACVPGQTCTSTDEVGCALSCNCADENVYSCASNCCPNPAVHGKTCATPSSKCRDACSNPCSCDAGVWACSTPACAACPPSNEVPSTGAPAYARNGTVCTYATALATKRCVIETRDAASNAWSCIDQGVSSCPESAVNGKTCTTGGSTCNDACGQPCTCSAGTGTWSCSRACNACPSIEELPLDTSACTSQLATACTYFSEAIPVRSCVCNSLDAASNSWSCADQAAPDCPTSVVTGATCSPGTHCRDACGKSCTCSGGQWQCGSACNACPTVEELPLQGSTCLSTAGTSCTYAFPTGAPTTCNCKLQTTSNQWSCP
jgi:hypothetical protein